MDATAGRPRHHLDVADFPEATALLDSSLIICDMEHPIFVQPMEVIEAYAATIREVLADPDGIMEATGPRLDPGLTVTLRPQVDATGIAGSGSPPPFFFFFFFFF